MTVLNQSKLAELTMRTFDGTIANPSENLLFNTRYVCACSAE